MYVKLKRREAELVLGILQRHIQKREERGMDISKLFKVRRKFLEALREDK